MWELAMNPSSALPQMLLKHVQEYRGNHFIASRVCKENKVKYRAFARRERGKQTFQHV